MGFRNATFVNLSLLVIVTLLICFLPRMDHSNNLPFESGTVISHPLYTWNIKFKSSDKSNQPVLQSDSIKTENTTFLCDDITPITQYRSRGHYYVLYNYIIATNSFKCDESITYTTNADFTFLDNVIPILTRWEGPISLSVYAPGKDFMETIHRISYLRECVPESNLVRKYVTFHIFFERSHLPQTVVDFHSLNSSVNCSSPISSLFGKDVATYRRSSDLEYPINVGRNIAREMATTHYVFASDIELYPSPNLIGKFLGMIRKERWLVKLIPRKVFVLSVFEIDESATVPTSKKDLVEMLKNESAIPFHKHMCSYCHKIPKAKEWTEDVGGDEDLHVFHSAKRTESHSRWEPFYIGTKADPEFDERLSWEGKGNKMTQGYLMCVLDYDFLVLDNAFLIHRPGIKTEADIRRPPQEKVQSRFIRNVIRLEYNAVYGTRQGCVIF